MRIPLASGAWLDYDATWLSPEEADEALSALRDELTWEQREIVLFGRRILQPRFIVSEKPLNLGAIGDFVRSHIDHNGAWFDPIASHHGGLADRSDNNVRLASNVGQIAGFRVANRHGCVGMHEEDGLRFSDIVASSQNSGV